MKKSKGLIRAQDEDEFTNLRRNLADAIKKRDCLREEEARYNKLLHATVSGFRHIEIEKTIMILPAYLFIYFFLSFFSQIPAWH